MANLSKELLMRTCAVDESGPTIRDMLETGIREAAEDDSYYYIISDVPGENVPFWIVDKKNGKTVRCGEYVIWIVYIQDKYQMMEPPYEFVIG